MDTVETVISACMSPRCDLELEDSKPIFLLDTLANDDASPYQVWLQNVQQLRRYRPEEHSLKFWTFPVALLDHNRPIQSLHKTIQLMMMCHQTTFSCKRISSSDDRKSYFVYTTWRRQTNLFEGHSRSWWCNTKPSLVIKGSAVQKISSGQTFIDLERQSNFFMGHSCSW